VDYDIAAPGAVAMEIGALYEWWAKEPRRSRIRHQAWTGRSRAWGSTMGTGPLGALAITSHRERLCAGRKRQIQGLGVSMSRLRKLSTSRAGGHGDDHGGTAARGLLRCAAEIADGLMICATCVRRIASMPDDAMPTARPTERPNGDAARTPHTARPIANG